MTTEARRIRGKVARILNSRQLVINIGSNKGVRVGMKFDVLDPKGEAIKDPDTDAILGSVERPKVRVEIIGVQERLALGQTYKKQKINVGGLGALGLTGFSKILAPPKWVTKYETLKTNESTWQDLDESESFVKTGDPVVQVLEPEAAASEDEDVQKQEQSQ